MKLLVLIIQKNKFKTAATDSLFSGVISTLNDSAQKNIGMKPVTVVIAYQLHKKFDSAK